jgi:hypothetical protein
MKHFYPLTTQSVSVGSSSAATTNGVGPDVHVVRLIATKACYVAFGAAPTATTSNMYLAPNREEYFTIKPGQKVAAIRESEDGSLNVTEMTQ